MIKLSGYDIQNCLYKGTRSCVYRGRRIKDNINVVLKVHSEEYPKAQEVARFKREYEIGQRFKHPNVLRYHALEQYHHGYAIVAEDFDALGLLEIIPHQGLALTPFLDIAIQLTKGLAAVHQAGIIHKDVKPSNILIHQNTGIVKLIDFGISTHLEQDAWHDGPEVIQGTIAYISPEQTCRMNRHIDYRTDFYSMGVTFYELLTGSLPFEAADASEMIHAHIAKEAKLLNEVNHTIPEALALIVERLMAKTAENRYQSAYGLLHDLERCQKELLQTNTISTFPLGEKDLSSRFQLSQKIFGRDDDLADLDALVTRALKGHNSCALVIGPTGSGKSRLIGEIQKSVLDKQGYFISGKFDDINHAFPFGAVITAVRDLLCQILSERESRVQKWRELIQEAIGESGAMLIDALPELEPFIGPQGEPPDLPPDRAQIRFQYAFRSLLFSLAGTKAPVTMLLDDMHLADAASLKLLGFLLNDEKVKAFVLFGTLSDETLPPEHPLTDFAENLKDWHVGLKEITLKPLTSNHITQMIAETLSSDPETVASLAYMVAKKTDGNPYFVSEFLKNLSQKGHIQYSTERNRWVWDLAAIESIEVTPNVVHLLVNQIKAMPEKTREYLAYASAIGHTFDLATLSTSSEEDPSLMVEYLWPALEAGLIYSQGPIEIGLNDQTLCFKFSHDRVQQVIYETIPEKKRPSIHLRIARYLQGRHSDHHHEEHFLEATNQYNRGRTEITAYDERLFLVRADIRAAKKAMAAANYFDAFENLSLALELAPESLWNSDYRTAFDLFKTRAHCAWLCSKHEEAERMHTVLEAKATGQKDRTVVALTKINFLTNTNKLDEAIDIACTTLEELGTRISRNPSAARLALVSAQHRVSMGNRQPHDLLKLEDVQDKNVLLELQVQLAMITALYQTGNMNLYKLISLRMVNTSLERGNSPFGAVGYAAYGVVLATMEKDYERAYHFGKLAMDLIVKYDYPDLKCRIYFLFGAFITHWRNPLRQSQPVFEEGYRAGMQSGSLIYTGWCIFNGCAVGLITGSYLRGLEEEIRHLEHFLRQTGARFRFPLLHIARQLVRNLQGLTPQPNSFDEIDFNEDDLKEQMEAKNFRTGLAWLKFAKLIAAFYDQRMEDVRVYHQKLRPHRNALIGTPFLHEADFLNALAITSMCNQRQKAPSREEVKQLKRVLANLEKLETQNRENISHKVMLLRAELARLEGHEASRYYDVAIDYANEQGFGHHVAVANELAGHYWLHRGNAKVASVYLNEAVLCYQRWGATKLVDRLSDHHAKKLALNKRTSLGSSFSTSVDETNMSDGERDVDLQAITKAFMAIYSELDYQKLVTRILSIVMENTGAQRGFLILTEKGDALIEAASPSEYEGMTLQGNIVNEETPLSAGIVRYVLRTSERLVIQDASSAHLFSKDEYVQKHKPKSILCAPLRQKGKMIGTLYLENNLATHAFTDQRLKTLNILIAQSALCLAHSRLYTETINLNEALKKEIEERKGIEEEVRQLNRDLEERVKERTAQLEESQKELVERAHEAGMADIATSVLHNVGNILTSVTTSSQLIRSTIESNTLNALKRANGLLRENQDNLIDFIVNNPKGVKLLSYYLELEKLFDRDHVKIQENLEHLMMKIDSIRDVIMAQQSFASSGFQAETILLSKIVDDALSIMDNSMIRHEIFLTKDYELVPPVTIQKTKLIHIIINILKNAKEAMLHVAADEKRININICKDGTHAYIRITDAGCGIPQENMEKIFTHGFTTKDDGHGFGLHSCANAMTEMNGSLWAESAGPNQGATFVLQFPLE